MLFYIDMLPPLAQFDYEIPYENGNLTIYNREDQPATIWGRDNFFDRNGRPALEEINRGYKNKLDGII